MNEVYEGEIKNKKKPKIMLIFVILLFLFAITLCVLYQLGVLGDLKTNDDDKVDKYLHPNEGELVDANSISYSPVRITCGDDETATPGYSYSVYAGDDVYCTFSIMTYLDDTIDEIWFDYEYDGAFKFIDSYLINGKTQWNIDYSIKDGEVTVDKSNKSLNFNFKEGFVKNLYNFYVIKFNSYKFNESGYYFPIDISNIVVKTKDNKYYKYEDKTDANGSIIITGNSNTAYSYRQKDGVIDFYKGEDKINSYTCSGNSCSVGGHIAAQYTDLDIGRSIITDINYEGGNFTSKKYLLFDFNKGVLKQFDELDGVLTGNNKVYYILGKVNNEQIVVNLDGSIIKNLNGYDLFKTVEGKMMLYTDVYSVDDNMIVLGKNGKKGIMELTTDKVIVDFKYDDVRLFDKQYFKYKLDDLWYIGSIESGTSINDIGYKRIFLFENDLMIVQVDNYLYFKKYDGTNIIEDKIEVLYDYQEFISEGQACGFRANKDYNDNNIINILITTEPTDEYKSDFKEYTYKYNISEKKLTKVS